MIEQESLLKAVLSPFVVFQSICQIQLCAAARRCSQPAKHTCTCTAKNVADTATQNSL